MQDSTLLELVPDKYQLDYVSVRSFQDDHRRSSDMTTCIERLGHAPRCERDRKWWEFKMLLEEAGGNFSVSALRPQNFIFAHAPYASSAVQNTQEGINLDIRLSGENDCSYVSNVNNARQECEACKACPLCASTADPDDSPPCPIPLWGWKEGMPEGERMCCNAYKEPRSYSHAGHRPGDSGAITLNLGHRGTPSPPPLPKIPAFWPQAPPPPPSPSPPPFRPPPSPSPPPPSPPPPPDRSQRTLRLFQ